MKKNLHVRVQKLSQAVWFYFKLYQHCWLSLLMRKGLTLKSIRSLYQRWSKLYTNGAYWDFGKKFQSMIPKSKFYSYHRIFSYRTCFHFKLKRIFWDRKYNYVAHPSFMREKMTEMFNDTTHSSSTCHWGNHDDVQTFILKRRIVQLPITRYKTDRGPRYLVLQIVQYNEWLYIYSLFGSKLRGGKEKQVFSIFFLIPVFWTFFILKRHCVAHASGFCTRTTAQKNLTPSFLC